MPTQLNFKPRPRRTNTAFESALPIAQRCLMVSAVLIVVLIIAQMNAAPTAVGARRMAAIASYLP